MPLKIKSKLKKLKSLFGPEPEWSNYPESTNDGPRTPGISKPRYTELDRIAQILGGGSEDYRLAQRVLRIQANVPGEPTVPEAVAYDWLQANQVPFYYESQIRPGYAVRQGDIFPDFVIQQGGQGLAWLIQGNYFHGNRFQGRFMQSDRDIMARFKLKGAIFNGIRIETVVELWESKVYESRPQIFQYALNGLQIDV